jgi:hypothetical protein
MSAAIGLKLRCCLATCCCATVGCFLLASAGAQTPGDRDYLNQVRRSNELAAQKLEADIRAAVVEAGRLSTTDPAKAADRLQQARKQLDEDTLLTKTRRDALRRMLQERIRIAEADSGRPAAKPAENKLVIIGKREEKRRATQQDDIARTLSVIRALQKEGKTADAERMAADLARRYPSNPSAQAGKTTASVAGQVIGDRAAQLDRERRVSGVFTDVDKSAQPVKGDIEFDKDFQKRTAARKSGVQLTAKEKAIMKGLATPLPAVDFAGFKFEDVMKYIADALDQPIVIDPQALRDAQIGYDTPINFKAPKGVTARTILRRVLGEFGLTYIIKDEAIQVVSIVRAREMMVTRTYYLGDLVDGGLGLGARAALWWPGIQQAQMLQNAAQIVDLVKNSIDPDTWKDNGGSGTISFFPATRSLVIRQSAEVHGMISGSFR